MIPKRLWAITVWQPLASLMVMGHRSWEYRKNSANPKMLNSLVAIHASGAVMPRDIMTDEFHNIVCGLFGQSWDTSLQREAILGVATMTGCYQIIGPAEGDGLLLDGGQIVQRPLFGNCSPGRHVWRIVRPRRFDPPVPCRTARTKSSCFVWKPPARLPWSNGRR